MNINDIIYRYRFSFADVPIQHQTEMMCEALLYMVESARQGKEIHGLRGHLSGNYGFEVYPQDYGQRVHISKRN